jgi:hypothetical protein
VAGQLLTCALVEISLGDLAAASIHAGRLTLLCLLATLAGRSVAMMAGLAPGAVLLAAVLPAVLAYAWMEGSNVIETINKAFGVGSGAQTDVVPTQP